MDGGEEGGGVFGVAGGDAAPAFEVKKGVFDPVAQLVEVFVIGSLHGAVFLGGDNRVHALTFSLFQDGVGVIPLVGQQMFGAQALNQP